MAAFVFPTSPAVGDVFFDNGSGYQWTGTAWIAYAPTAAVRQIVTSVDCGSSTQAQAKFVTSATTAGAKRVVAYPSSTTLTINSDTTDLANLFYTGGGALTIANPTGSQSDGQQLMIRIKYVTTATLTWGGAFAGSADLGLPGATATVGTWEYYGFIYNSVVGKWHLIAWIAGF